MKTRFALAALLLAAAPLHAQDAGTHRFDGGTFSIELPAGIPELQLVHEGGTGGQQIQFFGGGNVDESVVVVVRARATGVPPDSVGMRPVLMRVLNDSALVTRYLRMLSDTSRAARAEVLRTLADTSLAGRRVALQQFRGTWLSANPPSWVGIGGDARETVTDERITLRSPVTLRMEEMPQLHGTADMLVQRRGELIVWIVLHAAQRRTPAFDAATERLLDSFRVTGGR